MTDTSIEDIVQRRGHHRQPLDLTDVINFLADAGVDVLLFMQSYTTKHEDVMWSIPW